MGIHNRDYFRDDAPRGAMPPSGMGSPDGWAIKWIIGACVAMYIVQNATATGVVRGHLVGGASDWFALNTAGLKSLQVWRVFTYGLCHANISHILFNMIGVFVFGRMVERVYGSKETLAFFTVAIGLSGLAQIGVSALSSTLFSGIVASGGVIGASGGVIGLVVLAAMNFPRAQMHLLFIPVPIELRWIAGCYVGYDLFQVVTNSGGVVANFAHLGGAAVGAIYFISGIRFLRGGSQFGQSPGVSIANVVSKLTPKKKPDPKNAPGVKLYEPPSAALERDMDRVLDKMNREGKDSLTDEENDILMRASKSFQDRM